MRGLLRRAALVVGLLASIVIVVPESASGATPSASSSSSGPRPQTPILSARRFPGALQGAADTELSQSLDAYLSKVTGTECALVEQDGRTVYRHGADDALAPASVMKLATAITALDVLGRDTTLDTLVVGSRPGRDGVVKGDLVVVGGGDPLFTTKGYVATFDDPDQVVEDLGVLVDRIAAAGITRVEGSIVGDDSRHETVREIPGWPSRYVQGGTVAPLSALVVNDGSSGFADSPDKPNTNRKAGDPPLLFAQTLTTALRARGIEVGGAARTGRAPDGAATLVTSASPPMTDIVGEMLTSSDNTTAELLVREIGRVATGRGTTAAGLDTVRTTLTRLGFDVSHLVQHDGSGLDPSDRMPCTLAIALVERIGTDAAVGPKLPVGGRTGTLRRRMLASASTGHVRAKTGTLNGVNALAGFVDTTPGNHLTFAFLHNGNDTRTTGVADGFTDKLMSYAKGPKLSAISPLPAK